MSAESPTPRRVRRVRRHVRRRRRPCSSAAATEAWVRVQLSCVNMVPGGASDTSTPAVGPWCLLCPGPRTVAVTPSAEDGRSL